MNMAATTMVLIPVLLATVLAVIFRSQLWLRILAICVIGFFALLQFNVQQSASLMAERAHFAGTGQEASNEWREGAEETNVVVRNLLPLTMTMFAALTVLALVPQKKKETKSQQGN
jgi:hypothetical protein